MMASQVKAVGPLPVGIGLELEAPNAHDLLSNSIASHLRQLLLTHGLLVIRTVPLTPQQQIEFSCGFGVVEVLPSQPSQLKSHPEIFRVSNRADHGLTDVGRSWHSDGAYLSNPREISIFHVVSVPGSGGETQFASLQAAYDTALPKLLQQLQGKHSVFESGVTQPVIRAHPVTGQLAFYVKLGSPRRMEGVEPSVAENLFSEVEALLNQRAYTHVWRTGDIVVADNYSVAHRARNAPMSELRILHRTTILGGGRTTD